MASTNNYPRVLLVLMTKVKAEDPCNLLIRTEFGEWPKDHLAQIHALGDPAGYGELCGRYYRLQTCDRFLGGLFRRLRGSVFEMVADDEVEGPIGATPAGLLRCWGRVIKKRIGDWLIGSGLWEVIFRVRLSKPMEQFIDDFNPDLIYCQGYSLGFATLPLLISRRFNIPICFQTTDDWPWHTYRKSPVGCLLRRKARRLVIEAKVRMAFGEKMRQVYEKRYQRPFLLTYHADRFERFPQKGIGVGPAHRSIVFTGSLGLRRYEAINDLLQAVRSIDSGALSMEIHAYCSGIPKDVPEVLRTAPEVRFLPLPSHDALPSALARADVLFLPESFSIGSGMIELSLSTKCHLYMMSGIPILVYGPTHSGTVDYAIQEGWAAVVNERNVEHLGATLKKLLVDSQFVDRIVRRAREVAKGNHDLFASRRTFLDILRGACDGHA